MKRPDDRWLRAAIVPFIALVIILLIINDSPFNLSLYALWSVVGIGCALLTWEVATRWLLYVRKRHTGIEQTRRRVLITFSGYLVIAGCMLTFVSLLTSLFSANAVSVTTESYLKLIGVGVVSILVIGSVVEFTYYIRKYREAVQESEAIKKAGLQTQYDSLKNQVNPHFLFNALNALSALIGEDRSKALAFLDELASVYRYLLQVGQRPVVMLQEELAFLDAYRYLLNTRFGDSLRWEIQIGASCRAYWLPPLTLQTLIENALRHNVLLPSQPLTITVQLQPEANLVVGNTIQRKRTAGLSSSGGLSLLTSRYVSLGLPAPVILDDGYLFRVQLTLAPDETPTEGIAGQIGTES